MEAKLVFEIFRSGAVNTKCHELLGRGIALLDSFKQSEATKREKLNRDFTVPIFSMVGLEYIGAIMFSLLCQRLSYCQIPRLSILKLCGLRKVLQRSLDIEITLLPDVYLPLLTYFRLGTKFATLYKTTDWRKYHADAKLF